MAFPSGSISESPAAHDEGRAPIRERAQQMAQQMVAGVMKSVESKKQEQFEPPAPPLSTKTFTPAEKRTK